NLQFFKPSNLQFFNPSNLQIPYLCPVKPNVKAHIYVLAANIIYGINYSVGKVALKEMSPLAIVAFRVCCAFLVFFAAHQIFIKENVDRADHKKFILASLFGVAVNQMLFFTGLSLTSEMHASLIMITTPLLVLIMAWVILRDPITITKSIGILSGAAGVALLIISGTVADNSTASAFGDLCIFINATSYAIFLVIAKPLMKKYAPLTLAKWIFFYGMFMVIPFGFNDLQQLSFGEISTQAWLALSVVVFGATVLAYLFNILGLRYGSPALVSIYIYTQPIIATMVALMLGTDSLTLPKVISAILVFAGVALVSRSSIAIPAAEPEAKLK
ncbi:MAG TPA: DMT family transporter, partial [Chitinophagales bacterium]|nr:DMT family transporter [Chitinophagales bacterium]